MHIGGKIMDNGGYSEYINSLLISYDLDKQIVKANLKILLCGSYNPKDELKRVKKIRNLLIEKGWKKTYLTLDYKTRVQKNRRLLNYCKEAISDANVIVFLFTKQGGGSDGRGIEFNYILSGPSVLLFKSYFIIEQEKDGTSYVSELILGELENNDNPNIRFNTSYVPVNDIEFLLDTIESHLINHLEGSTRVIPPDSSL